jgi:hypothetical protein
MDIAALSVSMHQASVQQAAGISVLKMAMETAVNNGDSMNKLLESCTKIMAQSVQPYLGSNIDIKL